MVKKMSKEEFGEVSLPISLIGKIKERLDGNEFKSVSEYVTYVLKEVLSEEEKDEPTFTEEEEKKVKERLKALGYLD